MIKKIFFSFLILAVFTLVWPAGVFSASLSSISSGWTLAAATKISAQKKPAAPALTVKNLLGRLVLQKESGNKLWYIEPISKERYYLKDDGSIKELISLVGVKIPAKDFSKMNKNYKIKVPSALSKYFGKIIISPISSTTAYYINPADKVGYVINNYNDFYAVARVIGLSATDALLRQIAMNDDQKTYDPAFYGTAYVRYDGKNYFSGQESERLLPLASLSKLMTALVFMESNPNWNRVVEITPEEIGYPCTLQSCGSTSEIDLKAGDKIRIIDLWVAMLSASSNQAAVILADNSGLGREGFIKKMNEKAIALGLTKTYFVEMSGLSADNVSTAKEFAKIARVAFDNSWIAEGTRSVDYVFTVEQSDGSFRDVRVLNRNTSLLAMGPDASKTGYLVEAQRNAAVQKDGQIVIALHCYSLAQRNEIVKRLLGDNEVASAQ